MCGKFGKLSKQVKPFANIPVSPNVVDSPCAKSEMTGAHDFAVDLAKAGKNAKEIKDKLFDLFGDRDIKKSREKIDRNLLRLVQFFNIVKRVRDGQAADDQRRFSAEKTILMLDRVCAPLNPQGPAHRRREVGPGV